MHIAQIVNSLNCGGLEKQVIHLSKILKKRGTAVTIICLDDIGSFGEEAINKGLSVICLNKKKSLDLPAVIRLRNILVREKINVVHSHNMGPLIYGSLAAGLAGIKCINTRHGRQRQRTLPFIWNLNQRIVAVSTDAQNELLAANPVAADKVSVIYNAIDPEDFKPAEYPNNTLREQLKLKPDSFVLGIVARLSKEKDHTTLLKAFSLTLNENRHLELLIVGNGPLEQELKTLARELPIKDHVHFLGYREDIPELLSIMDLFVLSSIREGISLTLLEAMAAGKAIVATHAGGNPEVIEEGKNGYLVPVSDPRLMADALLKIIRNPDTAKAMGEYGKKRLFEKFELNQMVDRYLEIYAECLGDK